MENTASEDNRRSIGLIVTGGTIGSEYDADSVVRLPTEANAAEVALLQKAWVGPMELELHVRQPLRVLSENMYPNDWVTIAKAIADISKSESISGVLVLHGTDTATYTSAALSFLLSSTEIPIVLTGANLPPNQVGSDAIKNIGDSLIGLCNLGRGVYLSFAGAPDLPSWIHLGTQVRKVRASGQAFFSVNRQPVAQVARQRFVPVQPPPEMDSSLTSHLAVDDRVLTFKVYPGVDFSAMLALVKERQARGVVVELYASGTAPNNEGEQSLPNFVRSCVEEGVVVVATVSEAPEDDANSYESSVALREAGAYFSWTLLPEVAVVKLMWALAQVHDATRVVELLERNISGEI